MKAAMALVTLVLVSCATVPPHESGPTAGLGEIANTNGLRVRPLNVIEDSRCPANAQCVWAGRVVVQSEIFVGRSTVVRNLELGKAEGVADGALTLLSVVPEKQAGAEIDPRAYRFTFDFQGGL